MEIVISVSEAELEKFPEEEAPESSGQQEQSGKTSPICHAIASRPPFPVNYLSWFPSKL